jgi:UrcA family protein
MKTFVTIAAAALTALTVTAPAHAAEASAKRVAFADLDLSSPAGVETLNRRVRAAAKSVCGDAPAHRSLAENLRIARCIDGAIESHQRGMYQS